MRRSFDPASRSELWIDCVCPFKLWPATVTRQSQLHGSSLVVCPLLGMCVKRLACFACKGWSVYLWEGVEARRWKGTWLLLGVCLADFFRVFLMARVPHAHAHTEDRDHGASAQMHRLFH